jgi:hypothetical protein
MISGAQCAAAGVTFVPGGLSGKLHAKDMAGRAISEAIYFLIAAVLLGRRLSQISAE